MQQNKSIHLLALASFFLSQGLAVSAKDKINVAETAVLQTNSMHEIRALPPAKENKQSKTSSEAAETNLESTVLAQETPSIATARKLDGEGIKQSDNLHEVRALPPADSKEEKTSDNQNTYNTADKLIAPSSTSPQEEALERAPSGAPSAVVEPRTAPKLALTLAGGGARGAAHIGVLKVLEAEGIKPDFISANSCGAIVGSLYAAGVPVKEIESLFLNKKLQKAFFPRPRALQSMLYVPRYTFIRMLTPFSPPIGLFSGKSLAKFIDKHLPPDVRNIEDLKIPSAFTAVNLVDTKPVWMVKGSISRAVQASCTVPMLYRPVKIDGALLIDGGIRSNLPTQLAEAAGAPLVVAVKLHSYLNKVPEKGFPNITAYVDRITSVVMAEVEGKAVSDADILIEPKVQYVPLETFNEPELIASAIKAGEDAARAALPEIKRRLSLTTAATTTSPGYLIMPESKP